MAAEKQWRVSFYSIAFAAEVINNQLPDLKPIAEAPKPGGSTSIMDITHFITSEGEVAGVMFYSTRDTYSTCGYGAGHLGRDCEMA